MKRALVALIILLNMGMAKAQIWAGLDQVICGSDSVTLGAQVDYVQGTALTMTDDVYSQVIPLGFSFLYFGNSYDKILFSSNNYITFDTTNAGGGSNWSITGPLGTFGNTPANSVLGPWQDINPGITGPGVNGVLYGTYGPPGQRVFVAAFCEVPMFSCTSLLFSSQIKLFEVDNHIEMHIQSKPLCTTWNNGQAIQGLSNSDLSTTVVVPGRDAGPLTAPLTWNANQDGMSFFPVGNTYIDFAIPFSPTIFSSTPPVVTWFDSTNTIVGVGDTIQVLPPGNMTYHATAFICGAQQTITDTVAIQFSGLNPTWDIDSVICRGDSTGNITSLTTGNAAPLTYQWSNGSSSPDQLGVPAGTYYVTITDQVGCFITDTVDVFEADSLLFNPIVENDRCNNSVGLIIPNITGGVPPYSYMWNVGSTADTLSNLPAGLYDLTVIDSLGCMRTMDFVLDNDDFTVVVDSLLALPEACDQADGYIEVSASGGTPPYSYLWSNGLTGATQSALTTGMYGFTVEDVNGCSTTDQYFIPFHAAPIAGFIGPDSVETSSPTATFYDTTDAVASWFWQFGDGGSGIDSVVTHIYQQEGEYIVTLTVTDSLGCQGVATKTTFVVEEFFYYVPNAFTPNEDGTNDDFFPVVVGADPNTYVFQIYTRAVQKIFESTTLNEGWNGAVDNAGDLKKQDLYTWRLYFRTFSGREVIEHGTVTLIR